MQIRDSLDLADCACNGSLSDQGPLLDAEKLGVISQLLERGMNAETALKAIAAVMFTPPPLRVEAAGIVSEPVESVEDTAMRLAFADAAERATQMRNQARTEWNQRVNGTYRPALMTADGMPDVDAARDAWIARDARRGTNKAA